VAPGPGALAGAPGAAPPTPAGPWDETPFSGRVLLDAGPFGDIGSLSIFEQTLGRIPGVEDVYVRGFEGNRAHLELALGAPVSLVGQLRHVVPLGFSVTEASTERIVIHIEPGAPPA
jgi:hypothetical protein